MLCRLCVYEVNQQNLLTLFSNGDESNLTKLIAKYMHIEVSPTDDYSTTICKECYQHLNDFHSFFQHVEQRQYAFQNKFLEVDGTKTENASPASSISVHHNDMESLLDIKDVFTVEDSSLNKTAPQIEFALITDEKSHDVEGGDISERKREVEEDTRLLRPLKPKKYLPVKRNANRKVAPNKSQTKEKITKSRNKSLATNKTVKMDAIESNEKSTMGIAKRTLRKSKALEENKLIDDMIAEHMRLKCDICDTPVETFKELKLHFLREHNKKAFVTCCGTRFHRRFLLVGHIQKHLNPEHFKCQVCNKVLTSKICLNAHYADMHADKSELKYSCTFCDRRFAHKTNLTGHMMSHSDERNHQCEICKKTFKSNNILKIHIRTMHEQYTPYICETCGKEFKYKPTFERHLAKHQGLPSNQQQQCPRCGKWFSSNYIRRHVERHELVNVDCEKCGKTFKSKVALSSHMYKLHGKKRIYSCSFCDKTFKKAPNLKEHIDMHTGQKEYNCAHCPREFRSRANMYAHVKKMHFEQWTQAQLMRHRGPNGVTVNNNETENALTS